MTKQKHGARDACCAHFPAVRSLWHWRGCSAFIHIRQSSSNLTLEACADRLVYAAKTVQGTATAGQGSVYATKAGQGQIARRQAPPPTGNNCDLFETTLKSFSQWGNPWYISART
jgi:hypothetical protein